jgi:hypothetical protein
VNAPLEQKAEGRQDPEEFSVAKPIKIIKKQLRLLRPFGPRNDVLAEHNALRDAQDAIDMIISLCYNEAHVWKKWMSIAEDQQKHIISSTLRNVKIVARGTIVFAGSFFYRRAI